MTDDEVKRMLADQQYDSLDHRILTGYSLSDLSKSSLSFFRQSVATRSPETNFDTLTDLEFLKQTGGMEKEPRDRRRGVNCSWSTDVWSLPGYSR